MASKPAKHGTRTRFNQGCHDGEEGEACDACKQANRDYFNKRNQIKAAEKAGATVTAITAAKSADKPEEAKPRPPGRMEVACQSVLDTLEKAKLRPDLAAAALALAIDIDQVLAITQRSNLVRQYQAVMEELTKGSEKKSKLAIVRQMTGTAAG